MLHKSRHTAAGVATAVVVLLSMTSAVRAVPFANGSFESPDVSGPGNQGTGNQWYPPDTYLTGTDGWITRAAAAATTAGFGFHSGGSLINDNTSGIGPASAGDQFFALASNNRPGAIEQTFDTSVGTTYEVTWDHGYLTPGPPVPHTANYTVSAAAASGVYNVTAGTSQPFGTTNFLAATPFSFVATSTSTTLKFEAQQAYGNGYYGAAIDNVAVSVVPEPAGVALLAMGGTALARRRVGRK